MLPREQIYKELSYIDHLSSICDSYIYIIREEASNQGENMGRELIDMANKLEAKSEKLNKRYDKLIDILLKSL